MSQPEGQSEEPRRTSQNIEYTRDITKTVRFIVVCATIVICVIQICRTVSKIYEKPGWLELALPLLTALITPTGIFSVVIYRMRRGAREREQLLKKAQMEVDKGRTSSGLLPNGLNPTEDRI